MTDERRYLDEETREIFEAAAAAPDSSAGVPSSAEGLTLAELQAIGHEVGLPPERIAEAASALDRRREVPPSRTSLGVPISVGLTVDLPRAPTDREWDMLVAELRTTFRARDRVASTGGSRQWVNGNLHAYVEPTQSGYRLRMGTLKGNASALNVMGIFGLVVGLFMLMGVILGGLQADELVVAAMIAASGAGALVANRLRLPHWAWEREEQMAYIASRAQALIGPGAEEVEGPSDRG